MARIYIETTVISFYFNARTEPEMVARENWTRRWDAAEQQVLISQQYRPDDNVAFIRDLLPFLSDSRYIRIDGKPILIVYRPQHLPDPKRTAMVWREYCRDHGIGEIHLCAALTHGNVDYENFGFDSGVEFPPHNLTVASHDKRLDFYAPFQGHAVLFHEIAESYLQRKYPAKNVYRCVFPSWDNTARTGNRALAVLNGTPENYEYWLSEAIRRTAEEFPGQERLVLINAWNEWAEGCHLEPDRKYGRRFLEATHSAVTGQCVLRGFPDRGLPDQATALPASLFEDLLVLLRKHYYRFKRRLIDTVDQAPRLKRLVRIMLLR